MEFVAPEYLYVLEVYVLLSVWARQYQLVRPVDGVMQSVGAPVECNIVDGGLDHVSRI